MCQKNKRAQNKFKTSQFFFCKVIYSSMVKIITQTNIPTSQAPEAALVKISRAWVNLLF